jgi:hypothetical protein
MNELRCSPEDEKYKFLNRFAQTGLDSLADGLKLHPDRTRRRGQESGVSVLVCNSTGLQQTTSLSVVQVSC